MGHVYPREDFTPWNRQPWRRHRGFVMKTSLNNQDSTDHNSDSVSANENLEPLFGDQDWIDERIHALRTQGSTPTLHLVNSLGG